MKIKLQGLNLSKASTQSCELTISSSLSDESLTLNNFYFTFDSVFMVKKTENSNLSAYIYEHESGEFVPLEDMADLRLLSVCSNTNSFWILAHDEHSDELSLFQYSNNVMFNVKKVNLEDKTLPLTNLIALATDVNVYVFENSPSGLRCIYQLKTKEHLDKKMLEKEATLDECSISFLPLYKTLVNEKIGQFSCGKEHILMLTQNTNRLFSFGLGIKGQLGIGKIENVYEPVQLKLNEKTIRVKSICAGGWHSAFIDENFDCYMWGWNKNGQIGVEDEENNSVFISSPTRVKVLDDLTGKEVKFRKASLGSRHSILIDQQGNLYGFGWNKYSQLYTDTELNLKYDEYEDDYFNVEKPVKLEESDQQSPIDIKCAGWLTAYLID